MVACPSVGSYDEDTAILSQEQGGGQAIYRLLIADQDENTCETIRYLLDWPQYDVSSILTAASYGDAVNLAVDFQPHIALVAVDFGEHRGYELVNYLRTSGSETVFCMMSVREDFHALRESMRAGAREYLLKPINVKELRAFLTRAILQDLRGSILEYTASPLGEDPVLRVEYSQLSRITNKIILMVKSNYRRSMSLTSIANILNMSSKYIGRIFLQDTGIKFSEYLTSYRMIQARRLIENTREKISVVASMVGYSQLNNFYVHFKSYYHISPTTLREFDEARGSSASPLPTGPGIDDAAALADETMKLS